MTNATRVVAVAVILLTFGRGVLADVEIVTVTVRNSGNNGEWSGESYGGYGEDRLCGGVDYIYDIGKYEITVWQYTQFLNAVAKTDSYGLYHENMGNITDEEPTWIRGCNITRSGNPGDYTYSIGDGTPADVANWANRPVNYVSWGDAARFCNWLDNGQPGLVIPVLQDENSTETGSYTLNGATTRSELLNVRRESHATWVIPTEDEWYKAAYHKDNGVTGDYFDYPTSSDDIPSNGLTNPDVGNNATFYNGGYTIGSPYYRTEIGAHENSVSPYGTYDQGGNVWEWNESIVDGLHRGFRGGSFGTDHDKLRSVSRNEYDDPPEERYTFGFRVVNLPDCNSNDTWDYCDIDCGTNGGTCDTNGCGLSTDCNSNGIPDECDLSGNDCNTNGVPDDCEADTDNDGIIDDCDNCPTNGNPNQTDFDGDGFGDACDDDIDNDGVLNDEDVCDYTPYPLPPGAVLQVNGTLRGDLDGDCDVDLADYAILAQDFTGPSE